MANVPHDTPWETIAGPYDCTGRGLPGPMEEVYEGNANAMPIQVLGDAGYNIGSTSTDYDDGIAPVGETYPYAADSYNVDSVVV